MINISDKNLYELMKIPLEEKKSKGQSSKSIQNVVINDNSENTKIEKKKKNSLFSRITNSNSYTDLKKLKIDLINNSDLENSPKAKNLLTLIIQLNSINLNSNIEEDDDDLNIRFYYENNPIILTQKILYLFEYYNFFSFFFPHYNIDNDTILKIIPHFCPLLPKQNEKICVEGEPCNKFFLLLKGKISFRKKLLTGKEIEQFYIDKEGYYFGQWELTNNRYHKYTAVCKENCYLIFLPKDIFNKYIRDRILKTELDVKKFLINNLKRFMTIPRIKLDRFIQSNVEIFCYKKNDIIFKREEETKYLYLIYKGEISILKDIGTGEDISFISKDDSVTIELMQKKANRINYKQIIQKNIIKDEESKNNLRLEISLDKNKFNVMTKLTKGSFIGLENTTGINYFKYTYACSSDFAMILEINIENLDEHLKELMINLMPFFFELEEKILNQTNKITFLNYNLPRSVQQFKTRNKILKCSKYIESLKIEEDEKTFLRQINKINNEFEINPAGFIKMNEQNLKLLEQKNILVDKLRDNYYKSKNFDLFIKDFNKHKKKILKFRQVKMHNNSLEKKNIIFNSDKNKSLILKNPRPVSSFIFKINRDSIDKKEKNNRIGDWTNKNSNDAIFPKFKSRNMTSCASEAKINKNYNLYDKEYKKETSKKINILRKNKKQYTKFMQLQGKKNKNNIKYIKQGLSLDCKDLVKKVCVKNEKKNNNEIYNVIKFKDNKYEMNKSASCMFQKIKNKNKIFNNIDGKIMIVKNILSKNDKRLNFYDTGNFDMPLATQLEKYSNKKIY